MQAVTIRLADHDEELAIFGSRDQFLRQVRDALGVKVLARNGEIRVEGEAERVDRASRVFEGLRRRYRRQRMITAQDVADAIESVAPVVDSLLFAGPIAYGYWMIFGPA